MGTIAGNRSRVYHGYLIAPLEPPVGRRLLLAKLKETVAYAGMEAVLTVDERVEDKLDAQGLTYLQAFYLEGTIPVWEYQIKDAILQKRVWMEPGENTTYIAYEMVEGTHPMRLSIAALGTFRDHHDITRVQSQKLRIIEQAKGLEVEESTTRQRWYLRSEEASLSLRDQWRYGYHLSIERYRGLADQEDLLECGIFHFNLIAGKAGGLVCSLQPNPSLDHASALARRNEYERQLLGDLSETGGSRVTPIVRRLYLAADQFIVARRPADGTNGGSVIAGYPWFGDWGRDTMISLPGLTLSTGRSEITRRILQTFATHVSQGMLPNRFPDEGEQPEYNTVDASLWFFEALRAYLMRTPDRIGSEIEVLTLRNQADHTWLEELYPTLQEMIGWHLRGTRFGIKVDPKDGLLQAGESGVQLTWMDAKVDDWVVTPRIGKPVEINALWYNALRWMEMFANTIGEKGAEYRTAAGRVCESFSRFWNPSKGCLYDLIDGPDGDDPSIRPNQILALALPFSPVSEAQQASILEICRKELLTPRGLRSLSCDHPDYVGSYGGDRRARDAVYHQGTVWGWLIGPYIDAFLRVHKDRKAATRVLEPFLEHLQEHGVGSLSEIFDGDPPHTPRGCPAQAWTVAEVLRVWQILTRDREG
jgi:predicted glycogen debranching enzyme